jgi:GMP reductase
MRIDNDPKLDYADVLIRPKRSTLPSRKEVDITREFTFRHSIIGYAGIPIMAANMDTVGTFEMAEELSRHDMFTCIHKHYSQEQWLARAKGVTTDEWLEHVALSCGSSEKEFAHVANMLDVLPDITYICLDVANGYTESFVESVRKLRKLIGSARVLIAGNVVTADMTEALILAGADIVKVGIGPGSVCTTRKKAGVGYPQLSAVIECADAAHGLGGHIIADGGCTCPGDVAKAFGAGADFVMLGGMLAGHDECGGQKTLKDGREWREFYGMSSKTAQERHSGELAEYRASEGKRVLVPYKGPVANTVQDILGGVRSACTYTGSRKLKELSRRTTFVMVYRQTNESLTRYESDE